MFLVEGGGGLDYFPDIPLSLIVPEIKDERKEKKKEKRKKKETNNGAQTN